YLSSRPASQWSTFRTNCAFCFAVGAFIPNGSRFGPSTCAENIAASPKTATRPLPTRSTDPWNQPVTGIRGELVSNIQKFVGVKETTPGAKISNGSPPLSTRNADPVNVAT